MSDSRSIPVQLPEELTCVGDPYTQLREWCEGASSEAVADRLLAIRCGGIADAGLDVDAALRVQNACWFALHAVGDFTTKPSDGHER